MSRALLLLDVDGPLNPYDAKPTRRPVGYTTHRLRPAGWERVPKPLRVWLDPSHGPLLLEFAATHDVELVWATTWAHDANTMIGPVIGLPELPVIEMGQRWKFDTVLDYATGRPLAWLDDDFARVPRDRAWFEQQRGDTPTLLHHVDPRIGLTVLDLAQVARWLDKHVPADHPLEHTGEQT